MSVAAVAIFFVSCENPTGGEPGEDLAKAVAGSYEGYTSASCAMFEDMVNDGETLVIADAGDGTVKLTVSSEMWGTFSAESVKVMASGENYELKGEGKVSMAMGDAEPKEYDFTVEGTISSDKKVEITYVCPAVMGGLTIVFRDGEAPVAE